MFAESSSFIGSIIERWYEKQDIIAMILEMDNISWKTPKSSGEYIRDIMGYSKIPNACATILPDINFMMLLTKPDIKSHLF